MGLPAPLDHRPIRFVAVHRRRHAATAARDTIVATRLPGDRLEQLLERVDVVEGRRLGHVPPVEQHVEPHALDLLLIASPQEREQVIDVAMDVAVGEQAQEMKGRAARADVLGRLLPDPRLLALHALAWHADDEERDQLCEAIDADLRSIFDEALAEYQRSAPAPQTQG